MDRIIEIKVNGSYLTKDNRIGGVQHEANATSLRIEFDTGWDGYAKKVTFWDANGQNPVERTLTADLLEDITASTRIYLCPIPGEAMAVAGEFTFVIDGYVSGKRQRSISDTLMVREAPFIEQADQPSDPTPTQAEQLQVQIDTLLEDMAEQATIATNKAAEASFSENNAKAYANGGARKEQSASGGITVTNVVGAKDYANQAKVYAEGGSFDPNPHDGNPYTARFDGAKNLANKAKAFAESGTYLEWENLGSGRYEQKNKTVSKGAKQYAEDASNSASAAEDSKEAASDSASSAESFATAAEQSVASARSAASQAHSEASYASEQKSQAQSAASYADKFATQARQHMEQSREYYQQAGTSANNAAQSAASASTSEANAKASETAAKASETTAKSEADRAKSEADRAAGIVGDCATKTDLAAHTDDTGIHVTASEKAAWDAKADWNQNDSTAPDYIKNRICYKEFQSLLFSGDITLSPSTSEGGTSSAKSVFSVPSGTFDTPVVKIVWDGVSYELTPEWDSYWESNYVGNPNLLRSADPGEIDIPFVFYPRYETSGGELNVEALPEQQGVHTIEFWSGLTYVKIPEEYLLNSNIRNGTGDGSTESGIRTNANGEYSHAEGMDTTASGVCSHVEGYNCAASSDYQHVEGKYNVEDSSGLYAHIVGNGKHNRTRSNAHTLDWSGNAWFAGTVEGTALILKSSTAGSTKRFRITVDDSGTLTATEITG